MYLSSLSLYTILSSIENLFNKDHSLYEITVNDFLRETWTQRTIVFFYSFGKHLSVAVRCTLVAGLDSVQFPETLVDFGTLALRQNFASEIIISRNPSETTPRTKERSKVVVSELVARRILPFDGNPRCKPGAFSFPLIAFVPRIPRFLGFYYELTDRSLNIGSSTYVRVDIFVEISTKEKEAERDIVTINRSLRSYPADTVSTSSTSIFNEIQSLYLTRIDLSCKNHSTTFKRRICALGQHLSMSKQYYYVYAIYFLRREFQIQLSSRYRKCTRSKLFERRASQDSCCETREFASLSSSSSFHFSFSFFRFLERIERRAIFCKIIGDGYWGRASLGNIENEKTRYPKSLSLLLRIMCRSVCFSADTRLCVDRFW